MLRGLFFLSGFLFFRFVFAVSVREGAEELPQVDVSEKEIYQLGCFLFRVASPLDGEGKDFCGHRRLLSYVFFYRERTVFTIRESVGPVNVRI